MTAVDLRPAPARGPAGPDIDLHAVRSWRSIKSSLMTGLMLLAFVAVLVPLGFVIGTVISKGAGAISADFFTSEIPNSARTLGPGMGPAILGTLLITGAATLMAVPLGILGAVYLHEYGGTGRMPKLVRFMTTVMAGVPSIVMGLFVYIVFTLQFNRMAFGGSLALACLMLPIVVRSTEEMLKLVPNTLREGSLALGASKSRTILTVVLPSALPGVMSGALLAVARAAGETAPLIFTVGGANVFNKNIFSGENTALSMQIFGNATSPFVGGVERAWGAALTLVVLAFLFTVISRIVAARFATKR
jgi:phosphate transport system permease protein